MLLSDCPPYMMLYLRLAALVVKAPDLFMKDWLMLDSVLLKPLLSDCFSTSWPIRVNCTWYESRPFGFEKESSDFSSFGSCRASSCLKD